MTAKKATKPQTSDVLVSRILRFFTSPLVSAVFMCAILACVFTFDLFTHPDRSITFDGRVHITTISMYHDLLVKGEFPVVWVDAWGNYGLPLGLISYQTTSYIGGILQIFLGSPVMAYNMLFWLATFFSAIFMYLWLRGHVRLEAAILGIVLFVFAPYHIQNTYVRGALPEYVASVFVLLILLGVQAAVFGRRKIGYVAIASGMALLALTHPMTLVTGGLFIGPYTLYLWNQKGRSLSGIIGIGMSVLVGMLLSGYYMLPLLTEIKYLYYGDGGSKLRLSGFLSLQQLLSPYVPYFGSSHPGPPGVALRLGVFEAIALSLGTLLALSRAQLRKGWFLWSLLVSSMLIGLILPLSFPLFSHVSFLSNLQYAWRILTPVSIVIPFLVALLFDMYGNSIVFVVCLVAILCTRVPQLYGKNYVLTPLSEYQFSVTNLHTKNMAPVWAGESADYPVHREKIGIIEGKGTLSSTVIRNSSRSFHVSAGEPVRLVDYTFFFPGWKVYVDGKEVIPEYQDPHYRGVMTYRVEKGEHDVVVRFVPTRVRKLGCVISLIGIVSVAIWCFFCIRNKNKLTGGNR